MKPRHLTQWCAAAAILCTVSSAPAADPNAPTTRVAPVTDTIHGMAITDNYRWLEQGESPEVKAWTDAQMAYFKAYVDTFPGRPTLTSELTGLLSAGGIGEVFSRGNLYFSLKRHAGQNQPAMYVQLGLNGTPEVLIDPNTFSSDGTRAMDWYYPSNDGSLMAYGVSSSGTEQATLYVMKTSDRTLLSDTIPGARSASVAWLPDNSGFYYTRNPLAGTVPAGDEAYFRRIYLHKLLGRCQRQDSLAGSRDVAGWAMDIHFELQRVVKERTLYQGPDPAERATTVIGRGQQFHLQCHSA
jgi:prolyl oligopeptidase